MKRTFEVTYETQQGPFTETAKSLREARSIAETVVAMYPRVVAEVSERRAEGSYLLEVVTKHGRSKC